MFSTNSFKKTSLAFLSLLGVFSFTSCSDDDDNVVSDDNSTTIPAEGKPYVMSMAIQGSEGNFTYYTVPFENLMEGTLSAEGQGFEQPGYYDFTQIDQTIYSIGGLDDVNVVGISKNESDELVQVGDVSYDASLNDVVNADENTVISVSMSSASDVVTFRKFNKNNVSAIETKNIQVSQFTSLVGPAYSGMVVTENHLFLSYYISNPETFATDYTDQAEVAVFSYPELEFKKVITDDRVGPIGGFNVKSGLIKDENNNVYAISHSNPANGFSEFTKPSGILKINSGETEFDADYFFDIEEASGGNNTAHLKYLGNGRAFAEINVASRDQQEMWSDGPLQSAIVDLEAQTVSYIDGIPEHPGLGRRLIALQDGNFLYTSITEENGLYVYEVNLQTGTAEKGAKIQASFPAGIFKL
ncbi:DUF4374 domain-containing protein [Psychroflexus aestuariivivens]|uniref:DUF4374 domain-containing protein n=1 Tax=Psychroflexus aestuariivivens TaxID=1795040 RepID=UPI000FD6E3A1|nr:DUF4374 domain-containing protein [Psychroflexus aestuariivivens]